MTASDKQKAIVSLTLASETCTVVLTALKSRVAGSQGPQAELHILHRDFTSLLSLLHRSITKVALSLKPSSPTYSASFEPLRDISIHTSALGHCSSLFDPSKHGATLVREVLTVAGDVVESIRIFMQTLLHIENGETASTGRSAEEYLIRAGAVHECIDNARGSDGISRDNITAVRKKWVVDGASLDDCLRELREMIEESQASGGDEAGEDDDPDDGWDELGIHSKEKMDNDELERAKNAYTLLRLSKLLHRQIYLDLLTRTPPSPDIVTPPNAILDALLAHSTALLTASDELASSIYPPQSALTISTDLKAFTLAVRSLQTAAQSFFATTASIVGQLEMLDLSAGLSSTGRRERCPSSWFETCFGQIYEVSRSFALLVESSTQLELSHDQ